MSPACLLISSEDALKTRYPPPPAEGGSALGFFRKRLSKSPMSILLVSLLNVRRTIRAPSGASRGAHYERTGLRPSTTIYPRPELVYDFWREGRYGERRGSDGPRGRDRD